MTIRDLSKQCSPFRHAASETSLEKIPDGSWASERGCHFLREAGCKKGRTEDRVVKKRLRRREKYGSKDNK